MQQIVRVSGFIQARRLNLGCQLAVPAVIGLLVVALLGFAPLDTLHSVAHDTRHAFGFPCH